jgi:hypothetical protein
MIVVGAQGKTAGMSVLAPLSNHKRTSSGHPRNRSETRCGHRNRSRRAGISKAKTEGKYRGRPEDKKRNIAIMNMLKRGMSWNSIIEAASGSGKKLSRATLYGTMRRSSPVETLKRNVTPVPGFW